MTASHTGKPEGYVDIHMVASREDIAVAAQTARQSGRLVHQTAPRLAEDGRYMVRFRLTSPAR